MSGWAALSSSSGVLLAPGIGEHLDEDLADHERRLREVVLLAVDQTG